MRYGNRNRFIQRNSIFPKKKFREKITMEYYEGNRTRNWKEKQEQDGNERNGYWAKSHENADAIKRFLFLFYFFSLLGLMISTAIIIIIIIPTTFEGKCVRVWMQEKEMEACDWWRKKLKRRREEFDESPSLLAFNCHLSSCWLLIEVANPTSLSWRGGVFASLCSRPCAFDVWYWHIS